jgi:signal transduction histidine kinase
VRHGWGRSHPPQWWPAGEPWPPQGRQHHWHHVRPRFVRRAGCLFAMVLLLSAIGGTALVTTVAARLGPLGVFDRPAIVSAVAVVALVTVMAIFATAIRRVGRPMGDIVAAADRVASGDFDTRVVEHGPPWLRSVARAFNSMTGALQSQDEQRRNLTADIAHELRTPLAVLQGRLEGLLDGVYARDDAHLTELLNGTRVLARLVEDLRTLANAESGVLRLQKEPTDLSLLIHDAVQMSSPEADARQVVVRVEDADLPIMEVDPLRIREVLTNLLSNAIRHANSGGVVTISAGVMDDRITISVRDAGPGMAPEEVPKIFDRFYKGTTSTGSGLGLTIARGLVAAHGGEIRADSVVGVGTTMTVRLPRTPTDH